MTCITSGVLPGPHELATARAQGVFTAEHDALWAGALELIEVLLVHRQTPATDIITGIRTATATGTAREDAQALETRLAQAAISSPASRHSFAQPGVARTRAPQRLNSFGREVQSPLDVGPARRLQR